MGSGLSGKYTGTFYSIHDNNTQCVKETVQFSTPSKSTIYENALNAKEKFGLDENGLIGNETKNINVREYKSSDPVGDSNELYTILSKGGVQEELSNMHGVRSRLDDGTWVTYRVVTSTPDSPAVEIHVSGSPLIPDQKIHFVKG